MDYCAYRHFYHKPAHPWARLLLWHPKGTTGSGRCSQRCEWGHRTESGRWSHKYKVALFTQRWAAGAGTSTRAV